MFCVNYIIKPLKAMKIMIYTNRMFPILQRVSISLQKPRAIHIPRDRKQNKAEDGDGGGMKRQRE